MPMPFKEPAGAYFAHFQDLALHLESGQTIKGWLELDSVGIDGGGDMTPTVSLSQEPVFECLISRWREVGVQPGDRLRIDEQTWVVDDTPRDKVIARVPLLREDPYEQP